ncbi:hypothetical protein [Variovorax boronicumulans]
MKTPMKICSSALVLVALLASSQALAAPSYSEARKVYDEINNSLFANGLLYKKPLPERIKVVQAADQLVEKTKRLWPSMSRCREAAVFMRDYIGNLNSFALMLEGKRTVQAPAELYGAMFNAVVFGEKRAACYEEVESLDTSAAK